MENNKKQISVVENKNTHNNGVGGERKKEDPIITVVLQLDMHCEGCAKKIKKYINSVKGVEVVKGGDGELTKLTVIGKVDPAKLREAVEKKVKKNVVLISPAPPKKENSANKENKNSNHEEKKGGGGGEKKCGCCGDNNSNKKGEKKAEDNKAKEPPVTTAVMKVYLHCQGCIQKIKKTVTKTKGYLDMSIDVEKDLITVKGAIDMKALAQSLSVKIKKKVEIVPPKKEGEKKGGENEKEKDSGKKKGGENEKEKDSGKGKGGGGGDNTGRENENLIHYVQYGYPNPAVFGYGYGYPVEQLHDPGMFSDENPNACSVM